MYRVLYIPRASSSAGWVLWSEFALECDAHQCAMAFLRFGYAVKVVRT